MHSLPTSGDSSRRRFLAHSAKAFLGVSLLSQTGRPSLLHAASPFPQRSKPAKHLIYLYMNGGMSHLDTFDPKPGHDFQGPVRAIPTNVDGVSFSEYLPLLAQQADKLAVIRSLTSTAGAHQQANYLMHTSYEERATIRHPGMGAWLLKFQGRINQNLPGSVFIGGESRINGGGGFFEPEFEPLSLSDPGAGLKNSQIRGGGEEVFHDRLDLASKFDASFQSRYDLKKVRAYTQMYEDAVRIMSSEDLTAFDISREPAHLRDSYGDNSFGQGCLLARRMVEHGVRAVEVSYGSWDTHVSNFVTVPEKTAVLDQALAALLQDLESCGKLEDTLVVLTTEFGRTPRINQNDGRDHYPKAFSSVLAGGGIRGGVVHGQTNEGAEEVTENPVEIKDFNATIAYGLGIPGEQPLFSPTKRPFTAANKGKPVTSLFG